jgi:nucleotide-binding universal stress UspA family protein
VRFSTDAVAKARGNFCEEVFEFCWIRYISAASPESVGRILTLALRLQLVRLDHPNNVLSSSIAKETPMNGSKILFPTDFSSLGQTALEMATSLARDRGAKLLIVHVEEPPLAYGGGELYYGIDQPDRTELQRMLQEVVPTDPGVAYEHRLLIGSPAGAIVHMAEKETVDLIVMPTHGRTGLLRLLMGSVAEEVVRKAKCPVLTVKAAAAAPAKTGK